MRIQQIRKTVMDGRNYSLSANVGIIGRTILSKRASFDSTISLARSGLMTAAERNLPLQFAARSRLPKTAAKSRFGEMGFRPDPIVTSVIASMASGGLCVLNIVSHST